MEETLHLRAPVQPGSRIEIVNGQLQVGEEVDVVVSPASPARRRSTNAYGRQNRLRTVAGKFVSLYPVRAELGFSGP